MKNIVFILFYTISILVNAQCSQLFNLTTWEEISNNRNNWNVQSSTYVTETKTGPATFFLTPNEVINIEISGQFKRGDADIMGFTIGLDKPLYDSTSLVDGYLIDWKPLGAGYKGGHFVIGGMTLNKMDSLSIDNKYMWGHVNDQHFKTISSVGNQSLNQNTWNNFKLIYTTNKMICVINGDTVFNLKGCFDAGRFGFYDYSMVNSKFRNFSYKYMPDFEVDSLGLCSNNIIYFNSGRTKDCSGNLISNPFNPDSVSWDFGDGTTSNILNPTHNFTTTGTKKVKLKVFNNNGCIDSVTKSIKITQAPVANFSSSNLCEGDSVNFLDLSNTNNLKWSWDFDNGIFDSIQNPYSIFNAPGTYNVTMAIVDSNLCSDTITKPITIKEKLSSNLNGQINICDSIYKIDLSLPTGSSILWSDSSTSSTKTITQSGVYTIKINSNGCSNTDTFSLNLKTKPKADFFANDICLNETLNLYNNSNGSIYHYSWDFGNGSTSTIMNPSISYSNSGAYDIQLIVSSINNCKDTLMQSIAVTKPPVVDLGQNIKTCDDQVILNSNNINSSYLWSNGSTSNTTTFTHSGLIWLKIDSGNCSVTDSIMLEIYEKPIADFITDGLCTNDTLELTDKSSFNQSPITHWSWNIDNYTFNSTNVSIPIKYSGNIDIKLMVTNSNGCRDSLIKNINIHEPDQSQINTSNDLTIINGQEALLEAFGNNNSYTWIPNDLIDEPYKSSTISFPNENTTFYVYSYDNNGCIIFDSIKVEVYNDTSIYIPTAFTPNNDGNNDFYYISGDFICDIEYMIFNRWGQVVFQANEISDKWDGFFNGSKQNIEAFTVVGKAKLCNNTFKSFSKKLHLIR